MSGWPSDAAPQASAQPDPQTVANAVLAWQRARDVLATAKADEMKLREQLTALLFPTPKKGTQRVKFDNGYAVKLVYKLNYTLGDAELTDPDNGRKIPKTEQVEAVLDEIEKCGNEGAFIADRLIKTEYTLSEGEYNKLDLSNPTHVAIKKLIDGVLVIKPAAPTLELEEPKAK